MTVKKQRSSGVELLRILCMLQVIFLHVCNHGGYTDAARGLGGNTALVYWVLMFLSRCPVYVFILISGYFSCTSQVLFPKKKLTATYLPMLFYSVSIPVFIHLSGLGTVTAAGWGKGLFPFLSRTWYFMTLYLILLVLSPFINRAIQGLSQKQYLYLLGILFFIFSVWQFLAKTPGIDGVISTKNVFVTEGGKSIYDFVFMYLIGGYLRLHGLFKKEIPSAVYLLVFVLCGLLNVEILYLYPKAQGALLYNDNPLCVIQCVCLFEFFRRLQFTSRLVNAISACNIGIYMFHDHPMIRKLIWQVFDLSDPAIYDKPYYLVLIGLSVLAVFAGSGAVEFLRSLLFKGCTALWNKRKCRQQ